MKKLIILLLFIIAAHFSNGQIVASSCFAPDSIAALYTNDADRLAVRKLYRQNLSYTDSIIIPTSHSDIPKNALIAVYNAYSLPARDSVASILNIHTFPHPTLNSLIVAADSTLQWMQRLKLGIIPTGNSELDSLLLLYQLNLESYQDFGNFLTYHMVVFETESNYNLLPLASLFANIPGVEFAHPNTFAGDGNNIWDSVYTDHVELIYSYGWGDCPSGCTSRRFWKFNVYPDCSVEYLGSYGDPLFFLNLPNPVYNEISIYPNPFSTTVSIRGISQEFEYSFSNIIGQQVLSGISTGNRIDNLHQLEKGIYLLSLKTDTNSWTIKLVRE